MRGDHYFWLGASAEEADPAAHEPSRVAPSRPSGEHPLRGDCRRCIRTECGLDAAGLCIFCATEWRG
jgi:hypothetical protein